VLECLELLRGEVREGPAQCWSFSIELAARMIVLSDWRLRLSRLARESRIFTDRARRWNASEKMSRPRVATPASATIRPASTVDREGD